MTAIAGVHASVGSAVNFWLSPAMFGVLCDRLVGRPWVTIVHYR